MTNVIASSVFTLIAMMTLSGVAQAGRFDELELTIRVMGPEQHNASDIVNEIQLPRIGSNKGDMLHDKEKGIGGDKKADLEHEDNTQLSGQSGDKDSSDVGKDERNDDRDDHPQRGDGKEGSDGERRD